MLAEKERPMTTKIITASVSESDGHLSERPAIDWVQTGEAISFSDMEKMYKRQGGTFA